MAVVLLLNKKAKWFVPLSAAGVVVIIFGIAFIFSDPIMHELALPAEIDVITVILYRYSLIGYAAMLIAAFVWFYAVAKGTLPKRLQIVVPIMLPFIFILESIVMWKLDIPYQFSMIGHLGVSAIIILVSVFVKKKIKVENKE